MYLAPLNYDRFFKKVFSDIKIAKKFLEDFLGVHIEEIVLLDTKHKVTDDAAAVEFDFRCKIKGQHVIIDMQQWYKSDIIKRFYLYHTLNSALQLETMPMKSIKISNEKKYDTKNYDELEPVITLIWMANDTLKYSEDYIAFALFPEQTVDFLKNDNLWNTKDLKKIEENRQKTLNLLNNDSKSLDFLPQNRLIYIFQKNIVKNKKYSEYFDWFELAEKTRNENNVRKDFIKYEKNKILMAVIQRIRKDNLKTEDFQYIDDYDKFLIQAKIHDDVIRKEAFKEATELLNKVNVDKIKQKFVFSSYEQGLNPDLIATITELPLEIVNEIIENYNNFMNGE